MPARIVSDVLGFGYAKHLRDVARPISIDPWIVSDICKLIVPSDICSVERTREALVDFSSIIILGGYIRVKVFILAVLISLGLPYRATNDLLSPYSIINEDSKATRLAQKTIKSVI